jgi:hypothetical protein
VGFYVQKVFDNSAVEMKIAKSGETFFGFLQIFLQFFFPFCLSRARLEKSLCLNIALNFTFLIAQGAEGSQKSSVFIKHLHTMVFRVGDNYIPFGRVSYTLGTFEFSVLHTFISKLKQETSTNIEHLR